MPYVEFVPHAKSIVASAAAPFVANSSNTPGMSGKPTVSPSFTFSHINDDSWQTFVGVTLSLLGSFCFIIGWKYMHDANIERCVERVGRFAGRRCLRFCSTKHHQLVRGRISHPICIDHSLLESTRTRASQSNKICSVLWLFCNRTYTLFKTTASRNTDDV